MWSGCGTVKARRRSKTDMSPRAFRIHHGDGEHYYHPFKSEPGPDNWTDPIDAWCELWLSINGADSWNANPWVWVVEFKQVTP